MEEKKEEEKKEEEKKVEDERIQMINRFKNDGYIVGGNDNIRLKLKDNKFKLYFKTTLIAESESQIDENNIKTKNDCTKYTYNLILEFANVGKCTINNLKFNDIINNITSTKESIKDYIQDNCVLKINIKYKNNDLFQCFYDFNNKWIFKDYYKGFKDENCSEEIRAFVQVKIGDKDNLNIFSYSYYGGHYGDLIENKKIGKRYFKIDNTVKLNNNFNKENINNFTISLC